MTPVRAGGGALAPGVLLVEDDRDLLSFYRFLLELEGFTVLAAVPSGEAALAYLRGAAGPPDVVLLDHRLPGVTGLEVARAVLAIDPEAAIVIATADDSVRDAAVALGIWRFIAKPFDNERLVRCLREAAIDRARRVGARRPAGPG